MHIHRRMIILLFGLILIGLAVVLCKGRTVDSKNPWSVRMAESVMLRNPRPWEMEIDTKPVWEYTTGLVMKSILEVGTANRESRFFQYVESFYRHVIDENGRITSYKTDEYNLDRINPGKPLFELFAKTRDSRYLSAIETLRNQMRTHPRTSEGGFWHKKIYDNQMWLDGIYMAAPFLAQYAMTMDDTLLFDDVANQILLLNKHASDSKTGLLYHGWDESRKQKWANPKTGLSSQFWGRSMGWYDMGIVDALDFFPQSHPKRTELIALFNRINEAVAQSQDSATGVWYQVMDQGPRKGNYLESSASCMFVYAMAKGVRKGYLPDSYLAKAQQGFQGILKQFITSESNGLVSIRQACSVAGLGGKPYRDGSYGYYIGEKIVTNYLKAIGPFILASLEMESITEDSQPESDRINIE
jgi:unsaturated rhamnogalacturonyl hydrolase